VLDVLAIYLLLYNCGKPMILISVATVLASTLYPAELAALQDLYLSTNGVSWKYHLGPLVGSKWNFTGDANPCTQRWQGITCILSAPYYHVRTISLANFNLRGSLPESLTEFRYMSYFSVPLNNISGTLPSILGRIDSLQHLDVSSNNLMGSVPDSLSNLSGLSSIDVSLNAFTGPFPRCLQNLTELQAIDVGSNLFTGGIPCWLARINKLSGLYVYTNNFIGTLPSCLCNCSQLTIMDVSGNQLSGTIPAAIASMSKLESLYLYNNEFTGTLPPSLGALATLQQLEVYNNSLTGSIPTSYGGLTQLRLLALHENDLTGTLPASLGSLRQLLYLYLSGNCLSGTLPDTLAALNRTRLLDVHDNGLSGTLPAYFGNYTGLQFLALYSNAFSGSIPSGLSSLSALQELQLQDNDLTGSLTPLFEPSAQTALGVVLLENNRLTGTLPDAAFLLPVLTTLVAVGNCLHGTLPVTLCSAPLLRVLVLDGASSARACRRALLPGLVSSGSSYTTQLALYGTLPACLFHMPYLTTLHLSGNGFTGPLPNAANSSDALLDVALSHNLLTGTISAAMQRREWGSLDLSYNRLSGSLQSDFGEDAVNHTALAQFESQYGVETDLSKIALYPALSLENNRLSGRIPTSLRPRFNVSVLGTNLFACRLDRTDLPRHDSGRDNYQCGSDSFNVPYFLWLGLLGAAALTAGLLERNKDFNVTVGTWHAKLRRWSAAVEASPSVSKYFALLQVIARVAQWCTTVIVVVLLPLYVTLARYSGTVTHAYAWQASAAFLTGVAPVVCECVTWVALLCVAIAAFEWTVRQLVVNGPEGGHTTDRTNVNLRDPWRRAAIYTVFLLLNLVVVVGVNSAFVYVAIYRSSALLITAQVLISVFKLAWNNHYGAQLLAWVARLLQPSTTEGTGTGASNAPLLLLVVASLLNNIVIPCLVVALVSPDCFYEVFAAPPAVTSEFSFPSCVLDNAHDCVTYTEQSNTISYDPPFRYSYQCSASFVTYYAPAYVILCLMVTFVSPLAQLCVARIHQCAAPHTWVRALSQQMLPQALQPVTAIAPPAVEDKGASSLAGANRVFIIVLTFLGLLLTFGAVFPPLALAVLLAVISTVWGARVKIGRLLLAAAEAGRQDITASIERECSTAVRLPVLQRSLWVLVTLSCWFYTLFLFDTLGDAVGVKRAFWVLIVVPALPFGLYGLCWVGTMVLSAPGGSVRFDDHEKGLHGAVELRPVGFNSCSIESPAGAGLEVHNALQHPCPNPV
jgi:Leucine-rich repeat (LRR) protein